MPAWVDVAALEEMPLFEGLTQEQMSYIRSLLRHKKVPPGALLMMAEDPGEVAYLILKGTVKIFVDQPDGTSVVLGLRGPGEIIGEMSLVDRHSRSASVVTQEECSLLWWDRASFETCLRTMPALSYNLLRMVARRLRLATAQIQALATLDLHGRVARQILALAEECGVSDQYGTITIPLRLTQSDLAEMVGASRVRVNEVIVDYKERTYIAVDRRHHITVIDPSALARCTQ
jgi:CRP/FNR family cyclic AMP-dependent transcriptional regulator